MVQISLLCQYTSAQWDDSGERREVFFFNFRPAPVAAELVGRHESPTLRALTDGCADLIRVFSGKRVLLQRRQPSDCWTKKNSGLFSGPRTLNAHWCSAPARRRRWRRFCDDECEWQPYAGPLTHLPSWHTNPSHWFSAQRICSSAWPRMPLGHKMRSDFLCSRNQYSYAWRSLKSQSTWWNWKWGRTTFPNPDLTLAAVIVCPTIAFSIVWLSHNSVSIFWDHATFTSLHFPRNAGNFYYNNYFGRFAPSFPHHTLGLLAEG